jgi:hypothetical protein
MTWSTSAKTGAALAVLGFTMIGISFAQAQQSDTSGATPPVTVAIANTSDDAVASRSVTVADVVWTVTESESSAGPCIGVDVSGPNGQVGRVGGGCGSGDDGGLRWGLGGLDVDGQWYNVVYGKTTVAGGESVDIQLANASHMVVDRTTSADGLWVAAYKADRLDPAADVRSIAVQASNGAELASVAAPSIAAARARGQNGRPKAPDTADATP